MGANKSQLSRTEIELQPKCSDPNLMPFLQYHVTFTYSSPIKFRFLSLHQYKLTLGNLIQKEKNFKYIGLLTELKGKCKKQASE